MKNRWRNRFAILSLDDDVVELSKPEEPNRTVYFYVCHCSVCKFGKIYFNYENSFSCCVNNIQVFTEYLIGLPFSKNINGIAELLDV